MAEENRSICNTAFVLDELILFFHLFITSPSPPTPTSHTLRSFLICYMEREAISRMNGNSLLCVERLIENRDERSLAIRWNSVPKIRCISRAESM